MAEIALGSIPIAAAAFKGALEGYKTITEANRLGKDSQILAWKFRIQETRLRLWGREWGILAGSEATADNKLRIEEDYTFVHETLGRISNVFQDHGKLQMRYGLRLVTDDPDYVLNTVAVTLPDPVTTAHKEFQRRDSEIQLERNQKSRLFRRFRWALLDKAKLENLVATLKDYNDGLFHLLSAIERRRVLHGLGPELITTDEPEVLAELKDALTPQLGVIRETIALRQGRPGYISNVVDQGTGLPSHLSTGLIANARLKFQEPIPSDQNRTIATYHLDGTIEGEEVTVLVEWKNLNFDESRAVKESIQTRVASLAQYLSNESRPEGFCVPQCYGYIIEDGARFGLVFRHPFSNEPSNPQQPPTLHTLLDSKNVPPLGERFNLAYRLSLTFSILHTTGWLHKGIRSQNIMLSPKGGLKDFALMGFECTRPNLLHAFSSIAVSSDHEQNLYRHLKAQGSHRQRFSRAFDIYALGIVLLEIAYWRRIKKFWQDGHTPETFREDLWSFHTPRLSAIVGTIYMEVVDKCISGKLAEETTGEHESQTRFFDTVVRPLSSLVA